MVKFGKHKFKALNKHSKKQQVPKGVEISNKILKRKLNADIKVNFQKEILKQTVFSDSTLVKPVTAKDIILGSKSIKKPKKEVKLKEPKKTAQKPKQKSVEKHKKRQKMQLDDTKLLINLMKKSK